MNKKELEKVEIEPIHQVEYTRPKFWHRIIANFIDIFIFVVIAILLFIGTRAIVESTPNYKKMDLRYDEIRLDSGLYMKNPSDPNEIFDVVTYLDSTVKVYGDDFDGNETTTYTKIGSSITAIKRLREYIEIDGVLSNEFKANLIKEFDSKYDQYRLEATYEKVHLFVEENGEIIPNSALRSDPTKRSLYFDLVYSKFLDKYCLGFLSANVKEYYDITKNFAILFLALEIPVGYILSGILVWFVPGLFFKRGRQTLGKAIYHIGLLDSKTVLSPTLGKHTIRFLIFFFAELILSLFTFGLPYIISCTMMSFSKKKQGFPDYMLGLIEVDTSNNNIYLDYVEAQLKEGLHGKPIDFEMKKTL